jgi:hypothetical protein
VTTSSLKKIGWILVNLLFCDSRNLNFHKICDQKFTSCSCLPLAIFSQKILSNLHPISAGVYHIQHRGIYFHKPTLNECNIKHKLCTLRDNFNANNSWFDKYELFLNHMDITVPVFFWRIIIKRLNWAMTNKENHGIIWCNNKNFRP